MRRDGACAVAGAGFTDRHAALEAIDAYRRRLLTIAAERRRRGEEVRDQDFPVELFALRPGRTTLPPLVLLGGMGPLAGAKGFARACAMFGDRREIVLLQACSIPDRTRAILADRRAPLADALESSLRDAIGNVLSTQRPLDVIVLCNAAHAFLPAVFARMKSRDVRPISLVECVVGALRRRGPALILGSVGTRVSRIFTRRLDEEGIAYVEPPERIQETLMRAIYGGLKALDWETACAAGEEVFAGLFAANDEIGCIVAGCTEIPPILDVLKRKGSAELRERLSRIDIIDPVELALKAGAA